MVVPGERAAMGDNTIQTTQLGGRSHKGKTQKHSTVDCYKHAQFKCFYTNADSLVNKFTEFNGRADACDFKVIGVTEVKPKNQRFPIVLGTAENFVPRLRTAVCTAVYRDLIRIYKMM